MNGTIFFAKWQIIPYLSWLFNHISLLALNVSKDSIKISLKSIS